MTSLHALFALRDQHAFQRLLEGSTKAAAAAAGGTSSGGRSWTRPSALTTALALDVNARDRLGRTVLQLACAATDAAAVEYVRMVLAHPAVQVNLFDLESHWTALHRALYHGNLTAAVLLLQRPDTDASLTDLEGYTAFDLYNTTVENTKPELLERQTLLELFTWGANRNAALGHNDGDDRAFPEQVHLRRSDKAGGDAAFRQTLAFKLKPAAVRDVQMSRLHTVVVTDEPRGNVRACGFAGTGRLGPGGGLHTQPLLTPLPQFEARVVAVALGQDHTLALTDVGAVLSWGLNRFSQLGYDVPAGARGEEPVQATPRVVSGPLKKEVVAGVAACKTASACWTGEAVFTWGKNNGQLGYDKTAHPVQAIPRVVSRITRPVIAIALTDTGMACLLSTKDVILLYGDSHVRISFPSEVSSMPSNFHAYRPPHAVNNTSIAKVVCSDNFFAAVSSNGEIFTFAVPSEADIGSTKEKGPVVKPQRVWALRKQWSAVKDAALGSDGSIIICTESGHVFVRSRNLKSGQAPGAKTFKFQRVPYIQRAVAVRANETGAMSALRLAFRPDPIEITGNTIAQDFAKMRPYLKYDKVLELGEVAKRVEPGQATANVLSEPTAKPPIDSDVDDDEENEDADIEHDIREIELLCQILAQDKLAHKRYVGRGLFDHEGAAPLAHGADLMVRVQSHEFPVHGLIMRARSSALADLLSGRKSIYDRESGISIKHIPAPPATPAPDGLPRLAFSGCHPLSVLILAHYVYSDALLAVGDARVVRRVQSTLVLGRVQPVQVVRELQALASVLELPRLAEALRFTSKRSPEAGMVKDMCRLFVDSQDEGKHAPSLKAGVLRPDVVLQLSDRRVYCYSAVLRARAPFFECFFDEEDWTAQRWSEGVLTIDFSHLSWSAMEYVLRFMCCGEEEEMFVKLDFIGSIDQLLDFLLDVMSAANELLLDRLLLICSSIILKYVNIHNACAILSDASRLSCIPFADRIQRYMAVNMETLLESRVLDDLTPRLLKQLSHAVRTHQAAKMPLSRSGRLVDIAVERNLAWLAEQDIPVPIVRTAAVKMSPKLSPKKTRRSSLPVSPTGSPTMRPNASRTGPAHAGGEDIFSMDESDFVPALSLDADVPTSSSGHKPGPWRARSTAPRVDMKTILAEEEIQSTAGVRSLGTTPPSIIKTPSRDRVRPLFPSPLMPADPLPSSSLPSASRGPSGSPWRNTAAPPASPSPVNVPLARVSPAGTPMQTPPVANRAPELVRPLAPRGGPSGTQSPGRLQHPPGLGPVITPTRQPSTAPSSSVPRPIDLDVYISRSGGVKAWTAPPVRPVVEASMSASSLSFAEIQQLQIEQGAVPSKDKRSLKEIQAEEQERQAEADFLKWWAAEEERARPKKGGKRPLAGKKPGAEAGGDRAGSANTTTNTTTTSAASKGQRKHPKRAASSPAKNTH
ncbi:hypothetical protein FA95DRAFT_1639827 [Auriscalpium vulgare]|uniref:Uncharacterized protein n=1 Tax=Auriscalpium vulgare TaxID=40419 RepID=A0ACB8RCY0_9AGAM|nr:hypothetical protein FA95DRAFT_1639827 [Auriscalpium vulgare]